MYMETEEASYSQFSNKLTTRRREAAESVAPAPSASIVAGQPSNTVQVSELQRRSSRFSCFKDNPTPQGKILPFETKSSDL